MNEQYSYKDFGNQDLSAEDPADFTGDIIGSCFGQNDPRTVFPDGGTANFLKCNLDNCILPAGYTVGGGNTSKRMKLQKDMEVWLVDAEDAPISPMEEEPFDALGISKDPADIPTTQYTRARTWLAGNMLRAQQRNRTILALANRAERRADANVGTAVDAELPRGGVFDEDVLRAVIVRVKNDGYQIVKRRVRDEWWIRNPGP